MIVLGLCYVTIRISDQGKLLDELCDEVHSLKTELVKQTKEPVICLVQNNVYVNYGSPVCWTEKKGLRHTRTNAYVTRFKCYFCRSAS